MTPADRQTIDTALALIADVNDADAWDMLTAETRAELSKLGASFGETGTAPIAQPVHTLTLAGVSAQCAFDNGEHLILRWAANARRALAEGEG